MKLKWDSNEDGSVTVDGRFIIEAMFYGRTRPVAHKLHDNKTGRIQSTMLGLRHAKKMASVWAAEQP